MLHRLLAPFAGFRQLSITERWRIARPWLVSLGLLPICIQFARVDELAILLREVPFLFYGALDNLTLVVHEAGHFFFSPFGRFMMFAGGTLLQLLLPAVFVVHFYRHDYRLGTQLALLWQGQSFVSASIYAADGQKRILPLLGDNLAGHDWHNMLSMLGAVEAAPFVGGLFYVCSLTCFTALLVLPWIMWE